jgi:hypothetical protein
VADPIINLDEKIGKTVGRVRPMEYDRLVDMAESIMPRLPYPKGVYRFKSFDEANEWMEKQMLAAAIRKHAARLEKKI